VATRPRANDELDADLAGRAGCGVRRFANSPFSALRHATGNRC
jgi:hypothetical protein